MILTILLFHQIQLSNGLLGSHRRTHNTTYDGTDCHIHEQRPFSGGWWSHKFNGHVCAILWAYLSPRARLLTSRAPFPVDIGQILRSFGSMSSPRFLKEKRLWRIVVSVANRASSQPRTIVSPMSRERRSTIFWHAMKVPTSTSKIRKSFQRSSGMISSAIARLSLLSQRWCRLKLRLAILFLMSRHAQEPEII